MWKSPVIILFDNVSNAEVSGGLMLQSLDGVGEDQYFMQLRIGCR